MFHISHLDYMWIVKMYFWITSTNYLTKWISVIITKKLNNISLIKRKSYVNLHYSGDSCLLWMLTLLLTGFVNLGIVVTFFVSLLSSQNEDCSDTCFLGLLSGLKGSVSVMHRTKSGTQCYKWANNGNVTVMVVS